MIKHSDGVYEVENFLAEHEINSILMSNNDGNFIKSHPGNIIRPLGKEVLPLISNISNRLMSYFNNAHSHTEIGNIRRLTDGEFMSSHVDGGYPNSDKTIVFGVAIYLNDDFTGGEINYPNLNLSIKPKKASIVIHDASLLHKVLPVGVGNRYSITTFIFGDKTTTIKN